MIFSTSRGRNLDEYITAKSETVVFSKGGRKIEKFISDIQEKIPKYQKKYRKIHVYYLIGIPDITSLVREDGYEEVTFNDSAEFKEEFISKILTLTELTKRLGGIPCVCGSY